MAKISPVSIKYIVHAKFEAEGTVEKPDVIGALFGQTEGLLGEELELRELQKEGKVGRIDVELHSENGKTVGKIEIPCSIDKAETTIIGAALETIERVGPSDAKIEITKIEDVRKSKRDYIVERARKLMEKFEGSTDSREIENAVKDSNRIGKLKEYGPENLPSGDISGEEVIVVEGRADVINMLRSGISNVIAMNGTILPETIKELSLEKEITLFVDGDRGGQLIAKNAINNAKVEYIATAPDGKEVEELTGKEILSALRKKIKIEEFLGNTDRRSSRRRIQKKDKEEQEIKKADKKLTEEELGKIREISEDIVGTKGVLVLDDNLEVIRKVPLGQLQNLRLKNVYVAIIDGTATASVVKACEKINCNHIVARNFAYTETNADLVSL